MKTEAASVSAVHSGNNRRQKPALVQDVEDREREGDVDIVVDGSSVTALHAADDVHSAAHVRASTGAGASKPPLGLGKRKRKDTGLDEPMYRRAEAAVMESLWCGSSPYWARSVIRCYSDLHGLDSQLSFTARLPTTGLDT